MGKYSRAVKTSKLLEKIRLEDKIKSEYCSDCGMKILVKELVYCEYCGAQVK